MTASSSPQSQFRPSHVVIYSLTATSSHDSSEIKPTPKGIHESATRRRVGEKIAALKDCKFAGEYDPGADYASENLYFIPVDTLLTADALAIGINCEEQLFGGSVPHAFMATKSITHELVDPDAKAPEGWTPEFARAVAHAVLDGYTAFSKDDARIAAEKLLEQNSVRIKPALGIGGSGQSVITAIDQLDAVLAAIEPSELENFGVVLEQNLDAVITYSVGQVQVGDLQIAYFGTQDLTENHRGENVYGGSTLHVVRGNFDSLQQLALTPELRLAVEQACIYDAAANANFAGFFASRRNYDVAQGIDSNCESRSGVLEQSWRLGGASPAELAALEAFAADPNLHAIKAASWERYGAHEPPAGSTIYFRGDDPRVGTLVKYSTIAEAEFLRA